MTTPTYTPTDIVNFAMNKDAVNIASAFDQLIGQRVYDAIQARKIEVAGLMFNDGDTIEDQESEDETTNSESDDGVVAVEDETNIESEESHENAEQSA